MSPAFMNMLQRNPQDKVIPDEIGGTREAETAPEEVAFDILEP